MILKKKKKKLQHILARLDQKLRLFRSLIFAKIQTPDRLTPPSVCIAILSRPSKGTPTKCFGIALKTAHLNNLAQVHRTK